VRRAKPPMRIPVWLARLLAGDLAAAMMTEGRGFSNAKAKRELGWELRHTTTPASCVARRAGTGLVRPRASDAVVRPRLASRLSGLLREALLLSALFGLYRLGRELALRRRGSAMGHARLVQHLEEALHLPSEAALQSHVTSGELFRAFDIYYVSVHFPLMLGFLLCGVLFRRRSDYRWARNLLVVQTALALLIHIAFPLAPPRMFPHWGFIDTMTRFGPSAYERGASVANQFAAMPSLHVGWAFLIAYVVTRTGPRLLGLLAWCHVGVTIAVVVLTANHWWMDAVAGTALLWVATLVAGTRPTLPG
jgi:hypothetical protein